MNIWIYPHPINAVDSSHGPVGLNGCSSWVLPKGDHRCRTISSKLLWFSNLAWLKPMTGNPCHLPLYTICIREKKHQMSIFDTYYIIHNILDNFKWLIMMFILKDKNRLLLVVYWWYKYTIYTNLTINIEIWSNVVQGTFILTNIHVAHSSS